MAMIVPTVGRIVLFSLSSYQAEQINKRRADAARGNPVVEGDILPAMVVRVWGRTPECSVNIKVMLDGSDDLWVMSTSVEDEHTDGRHTPGRYHWMVYQQGQAAKFAIAAAGQTNAAS